MNAYPDARWVDLKFTFEFIDQEAREDAHPASSGENEASQIMQTVDDIRSLQTAYVSLDHNRWGLNRNFVPLPDRLTGVQTGWICSPLSDASCRFASDPYLEFTFSEEHSSIGFTIRFEDATGAHASEFLVQTFDSNGTVITSAVIENHSAVAVVNLLSPNYRKVRFTFSETSRPKSRIRIGEVLFGIIESYDANTISGATLQYSVDPIAEALPARECVVRIDNSDQRFNIINPNGIYAYLQQPQSFHVQMGIGADKDNIEYVSMGDFYFATASAEDSSLTAEITAYDWIYWLEKGTFKNAETGSWTLYQAVTAILDNAGIECEVVMPSSVAATPLLKTTEDMTNREALRLAVQASCCTAYFDRESRLVILNLALSSPVDALHSGNMTQPPKVKMTDAVNKVELTVRDESQGTEAVYTASNIARGEMPQVKSVRNNMVAPSRGQAVADWLLAGCQGRLTYSTTERGNPETKLAETVKIYDYFGVNRNAVVTKQVFKYNGGLSAESEAISNGS